ncbi:MAG: phasin family protein [Pseudomonadota bacterium]
MFEQLNEQLKESMKPFSELATLNMTTMQEVAEKQNALYTKLLNDGVSFAETAGQQKDVMSLAEAQKAYFEGLQETITETAKETYTVVSEAQQKAGEMLKTMSEEVSSKFAVAK